MKDSFDLDAAVGKVPDFPKAGILFYDITSVLLNPDAYRYCVSRMEELFAPGSIDAVAGVEARGFLFAAPVAHDNHVPLLLLRKKGKLPRKTVSSRFELEYGEDEIHLHEADLQKGARVLLIDDLVATGGTLRASADLLMQSGARSVDICCVIGLPFLGFRKKLEPYRVETLLDYEGE